MISTTSKLEYSGCYDLTFVRSSKQILFYQRSANTAYNFPVELFQHDEVGDEVKNDIHDYFDLGVCLL